MPTYVSQQGLQDLKDEFSRRTTIVRREIAEKIAAAKELGDLSENFEYHEAKEQQGFNEARILEVEDMIRDAVIVEETTGATVIQIGTTFTVSSKNGEKTFSLVGSNESNPLEGKISNESPMGLAFIGHEVGDKVEIQSPGGTTMYTIVSIK